MIHARHALWALSALLITATLAGSPATAEDDVCQCKDLIVRCRLVPQKAVLVGDEFCIEVEVENVNQLPLEDVQVRIRPCELVKTLDPKQLELRIPLLGVGKMQTLRACFQAQMPGECRISAHAKDKEWVTAAGCICTTVIKGLPAIQLEMIDLDRRGNAKGIFEVGEEFIYRCTVENDVGTSITPDLLVRWDLPPELEFVSGKGEGRATVSGSGQRAESSMFVLAPPKGMQTFELRVRVLSVPPRNLIQTRATVLSPGGQELALETESTTLKPAAR